MEVKTNHNINDIGYAIYNGKIVSGPIKSIDTHTTFRGQTKVSYVLGGNGDSQSPATYGRDESEVFASEEDLLKGSREVKV